MPGWFATSVQAVARHGRGVAHAGEVVTGLAIGDRIGAGLPNISLANEILGEPSGEPNGIC
jgi:hypothetical protein